MPETPTVPNMTQVSKEQFFACMNPKNVHPYLNDSPHYSAWKYVGSQSEIGRSYPGWKNPGDPEFFFLRNDFAKN